MGHVFVGDKEGGAEFTRADEETLVMFASQAALVIANARTHREERQARADLETLVSTSPVGVAVFDVRTGAPLSLNREALRIVDGLREGDQPPQELLGVVTCVRADGREVSLAELPLVMADRRRILQVLGNLLSNAARSSPGDSPITVSAARDGVHVAVSVSDQGRGVPAELLPELFRRFPRGFSAGHAGSVDGSGLGLAICRGIVEAHGGRIRAESAGPGRRGPRAPSRLSPAFAARPQGAACWPWTTTPRTCATSATSSPGPATPRS